MFGARINDGDRGALQPLDEAVDEGGSGRPCPDDDELAVIYGTSSPGRLRRLLDHYEKTGLIVVRTDFSGRRSVSIPELGLATEPLEA